MAKKAESKKTTKTKKTKARSKASEQTSSSDYKRLYRSKENKVVAGVCGGIAEYLETDPVWIRLLAVFTIFLNGIGIILYILAWIFIPENPNQRISSKTKAENIVDDAVKQKKKGDHGPIFGIILIVLGSLFLVKRYFPSFDFDILWPLVLVGVGAMLLIRGKKK